MLAIYCIWLRSSRFSRFRMNRFWCLKARMVDNPARVSWYHVKIGARVIASNRLLYISSEIKMSGMHVIDMGELDSQFSTGRKVVDQNSSIEPSQWNKCWSEGRETYTDDENRSWYCFKLPFPGFRKRNLTHYTRERSQCTRDNACQNLIQNIYVSWKDVEDSKSRLVTFHPCKCLYKA